MFFRVMNWKNDDCVLDVLWYWALKFLQGVTIDANLPVDLFEIVYTCLKMCSIRFYTWRCIAKCLLGVNFMCITGIGDSLQYVP